jgi:hypothetical protein
MFSLILIFNTAVYDTFTALVKFHFKQALGVTTRCCIGNTTNIQIWQTTKIRIGKKKKN